jgi:stage II sporulation protein D
LERIFGKKVHSLAVVKRNRSGRVELVKIAYKDGNYNIRGEKIRTMLGLKSRFFTINRKAHNIIISGRGYGHGVGMCQYGAVGLAVKGYNYKSILKYYYKGIRIEKGW